MNKAIYQPKGKAAEYAKWACNFYVGCSNGCEYCYLKKGRGAKILGGDKPTLKKCFRDESHAIEVFVKEMEANLPELQKHGIFFSFSTDPMIARTKRLTIAAVKMCNKNKIPVKVLTKETGYVYLLGFPSEFEIDRSLIAVGFTLTGHDELEPGASTNAQRIRAMELCKESGFKTFASIEPIIDFESSLEMIRQTIGLCYLYKIGLESGKKYDSKEFDEFMFQLTCLTTSNNLRVYLKDSVIKKTGNPRQYYDMYFPTEFVTSDYNIFKGE